MKNRWFPVLFLFLFCLFFPYQSYALDDDSDTDDIKLLEYKNKNRIAKDQYKKMCLSEDNASEIEDKNKTEAIKKEPVENKDEENEEEWERVYNNPQPGDVNIRATGFEWIEYPWEEKVRLMEILFDFWQLDRNIYNVEQAVFSFDVHYFQAAKMIKENPEEYDESFFEVPCLLFLGTILKDKESDWGSRSLMKSNKNQELKISFSSSRLTSSCHI